MNSDVCKKMLNVTEKVQDLPIAIYFRQLPEGIEDYYEIIKKPISFEQIVDKINSNKYHTIQEWLDDIAQIWKNCLDYNGPTHYLTLVAKDLERVFNKESRIVTCLTTEGFCKETHRLQAKIAKYLQNPPIKGVPVVKKVSRRLPSEKELTSLVIALDLVNTDSDIDTVKSIINARQPELLKGGKNTIDVSRLTHETVLELQRVITNALMRQGLQYPS